jgi:uncharacterized protein (DUF342 family)
MGHEKLLVTIDKSDLTAKLRIRGSAYDPTVTLNAVIDHLNEKAIQYGVDFRAIEEGLREYQQNGRLESEIIVAKGKPVVEPKDGRVEIFVKEAERVAIDDMGHADFRNIHRYVTVKQDQLLARMHYPVRGEAGFNIHGIEIPPREPASPTIDAGDNVRIEEREGFKEFFANTKGVFIRKGKSISVSPVLHIEKSIGLETGNIDYDGDIIVKENIERGSSLAATGNVTVGGMVESGEIRIGGSFRVKSGINTKNEGRILVKQNLTSGYIDNSKIFVGGDITVEKSITISSIITHGGIILTGNHCAISGGNIISYGSIKADYIGSKGEIPTVLTIGLHYEKSMRLKHLSDDLEKTKRDFERLTDEIQKIRLYVQRMRNKITDDKREELKLKLQEYKATKELAEKLEADIQTLRSGRYNQEDITVVARDTLYPGVQIHYRNSVERIMAPLTKCMLVFTPGREKPEILAYTED